MRLIASSLLAGLIAVSAVAPAFADQRGRGKGHGHNDRGGHDRDYRDGYRDGRRDGNRHDDRGGRGGRGDRDDRGPGHGQGRGRD